MSTTSTHQVVQATEGFVAMIDGERLIVQEGITRVSAGHPLAKAYPQRFKPVEDDLTFAEDSDATAEPGQRQRRAVRTTAPTVAT